MTQLLSALLAARQSVHATVFKAGKNKVQDYDFVGHEHVLTSGVREALLNNGLLLEEREVSFLGAEVYKTKSGENTCWRWRGRFTLSHTSGAERDYTFEATTGPNDKAGFVASTALDRTALMRIMQLAGSKTENPEHDSNEQGYDLRTGEAQAQQRQPTPAEEVAMLVDIDLPKCANKGSLVVWAKLLIEIPAKDKQKAWAAFGERCASLELVPKDVVEEARKAA